MRLILIFVFFFIYMFILLVDGGISVISPTLVALSVALAIPIGYVTYQTYVMTIYRCVWERWFKVPDPCFELLDIGLQEKLRLLDKKLAERVRKRISRRHMLVFLNQATQKESVLDYRWRLVNLINSRGVGIFSGIIGLLIPMIYPMYCSVETFFTSGVFSLEPFQNMTSTSSNTLRLAIYYLIVLAFIAVLAKNIYRIKTHLADFDIGIIGSNKGALEELIWIYLSFNTFAEIREVLERSKENREKARELLLKTYGNLIKGEWEQTIRNASKLYSLITTSKG